MFELEIEWRFESILRRKRFLTFMTVRTKFPTEPPLIYLEEGLLSPHWLVVFVIVPSVAILCFVFLCFVILCFMSVSVSLICHFCSFFSSRFCFISFFPFFSAEITFLCLFCHDRWLLFYVTLTFEHNRHTRTTPGQDIWFIHSWAWVCYDMFPFLCLFVFISVRKCSNNCVHCCSI